MSVFPRGKLKSSSLEDDRFDMTLWLSIVFLIRLSEGLKEPVFGHVLFHIVTRRRNLLNQTQLYLREAAVYRYILADLG